MTFLEEPFNGEFKGRKVLITGHTGFKGSWLSLLLHKLGAKVSGYSLEPHTKPNLFEVARIKDFSNSYIGDIRNYKNLINVIREVQPEIVIHMAAQALVLESYKNPQETYQVNVMGTVNLMEAIRNTPGVKAVVNVTSDKCYENREWQWGYRENEPMGGFDPYSSSKACSELVTASYRNSFFNPKEYEKHGVAIASARAGNVIGGGDWSSNRIIPDFIRAVSNNQKVMIRNPNAVRPWQHVLEPLSGYLLLASKLFRYGPRYAEAWNFGPDDSDARPVEWIIKTACKLWGDGAEYYTIPNSNPHEANYLKLDCSKARSILEWKPKWGIITALEKTVSWNKAFINGYDIQKTSIDQIEEYYNKN